MKKFVSLIIALLCYCIFVCLPFFVVNTKAQSKYLRVINHSTPFYKNATDSVELFFLPYTYYVEILDTVGDFYHVEVFGLGELVALDGFVPKSALFDDGLTVEHPFLTLSVYTCETAVLYADIQLSTPIQYVFPERELAYYGSILTPSGNAFFVEYNGRLGYVKEQCVLPFSIPNHPNPLTFLAPPDEQSPEPNNDGDFLSLRVTIIACLAFAGVIGLLIAFGNKRQSKIPTCEYYDENEYSNL